MAGDGVSYELTELEWDVVLHNMPLVLDRVKVRRLDWHDAQDARQEGMFGLMRAVAKCVAEKGALSTVAVKHIDARITRARHRLAASVHIPEYIRYRPDHPDHPLALAAMACGRLDAEDAAGRPFAESLADPRAADHADDFDRERTLEALRDAIADLPDREREIVERRMAGEIYRDIGRSFGFSRQRTIQLERRAHERLREALAEYA